MDLPAKTTRVLARIELGADPDEAIRTPGQTQNGWSRAEPFGNYGSDYWMRAVFNLAGIVAVDAEHFLVIPNRALAGAGHLRRCGRRMVVGAVTTIDSPARSRALSAKTFGVLAVIGMVIAFSLSSTLVKRAESPGVLVAFWRMIAVSVVWNVLLWSTGRRITLRNVRQALVPGVFFGLNLAVFFAGATHNSVANAALIGSLSPFLIVPVGAWLFKEYIEPRALVFALVAFGGVALVLFSAPANGDASLEGNVFGFLAMLLLVGYVASTKHFRQDMDVTTFMSTICPIAALAVLPLAIVHGDMFGMSGTGWTYTLILTLTSGVAAQGLMVFAQKTIQIGTIAISQVAQPALAVVWSFLLLGEVVNHRQLAGIAVVVSGLLAFVAVHQRGELRRAA